MAAYRKHITVEDPDHVVLSNLPFKPGQRIEVVLIPEDDEKAARIQELKDLLRTTQALPQAQSISEEEVEAEIAAYRAGK